MISELDRTRITKTFPFLSEFNKDELQGVFSDSVLVTLKEKALVTSQGDQCTHIPLVLQGSIRVFKVAESGREITLYRVEQGASCILTATCVLGQNTFPAIAEIDDEVEAVLIPAKSFQKYIAGDETWRKYLFQLYHDRLSSVITLLEEVTFNRIDQRIAKFLVSNVNQSDLSISITHQQLAIELGSSREVISRILKDMEKRQLIKVFRGEIVITDLKYLRSQTI